MRAGIKRIFGSAKKMQKRKIFICLSAAMLFAITVSNSLFAQGRRKEKESVGYGGSLIYNFHATGFGADLRVKIPIVSRLSVVPQVSYFPAFNDYHELYAGAALHYEFARLGNWNLYIHGAGFYNDWMNAEDYAPGQKKQHNFAYEAGGGIVRSYGCIRPFLEDGYDIKWKENSLRIGIYIYPGACGGKEDCPAYDD
jgi:hypothetical protein